VTDLTGVPSASQKRRAESLALQPRNNAHGFADLPSTQTGFVARYNPAANKLVFSTYLGGSVEEYLMGLAVDSAGTVYVSGYTYSRNFPHTADALQPSFGGGVGSFPTDGFLSVLSSDGSRLIYSTFLGGSGQTGDCNVALDPAGNVFVGGDTTSSFPVQHLIRPYPGSGSLFVLKFSPIPVPPPLVQFTGSLTISNALFRMRLTGPSGSNVVLEASANFHAWTPIQTNVLSPTGLDLSVPLGTNQQQFFRARLAP
jgi:hypothetical protein